jgi:predicted AlkP superfamily phosphohydrolase/phosphomutase
MGRRLEQKLVTPERSRRSCFAVLHNDISGAIRINLAGREPNGKIQPGAECDAFCERLTRDLLEIVNADTGEPIVREVVRTADLYKGEHSDDYADLFAVWNKSAPNWAVCSPKIGTIKRRFTANRTGDHTDHGLILARGPGIAPVRLAQPVSVLDFAPTVASLLGVDLPDVEGAPIDGIARAKRVARATESVVTG